MIQRIILLLSSLVVLSSCFGFGGTDTATSGLEGKVLDNFTVSIPSNWKLVTSQDTGVPNPTTGKLVLAATSPDIKNGFSNTFSILEETFRSPLSLETYIGSLRDEMKKDFYSFRVLEDLPLNFIDTSSSQLLVFDAQYNQNTPILRYLQTAQVCEGNIYIMTLAIDRTIEDYTKYIALLQTFACKTQK